MVEVELVQGHFEHSASDDARAMSPEPPRPMTLAAVHGEAMQAASPGEHYQLMQGLEGHCARIFVVWRASSTAHAL